MPSCTLSQSHFVINSQLSKPVSDNSKTRPLDNTDKGTGGFLKPSPRHSVKDKFFFHKEGYAAWRSTLYTAFWFSHSHFQSLRFTLSSSDKALLFSYYSPNSRAYGTRGWCSISYFQYPFFPLNNSSQLVRSWLLFKPSIPLQTTWDSAYASASPLQCELPTEQRAKRMINLKKIYLSLLTASISLKFWLWAYDVLICTRNLSWAEY